MARYDGGEWVSGSYADDGELLGGYSPDSILRIAISAASKTFVKTLPHSQRKEIALGAIIDYLCEWDDPEPPGVKELFDATRRALESETWAYERDHCFETSGPSDHENLARRRWSMYWLTTPRPGDHLAEQVTERVAVWQLLGGLKAEHAEALRVFASTQLDTEHGCGSYEIAAARLEMTEPILRGWICRARKAARWLWVADDETPRPKWGADRGVNHKRGMNIMTSVVRRRRKAGTDG